VGLEKREALERVRRLKPMEAPVAAILPEATVHWAE
jgi:6-phosphogluconolactonase